jgi:exodeoxyribonuclease V beta subunit
MKPFDLLNAPLDGVNLIEASAGTGKTYNIEGLFLRLILEMQLPVEQILVLTFTKAATAELKERIRGKLVQAGNAFAGAPGEDALLQALVKHHPRKRDARQQIHEALINFDQAAIFTIHGFCQRILHENAFETGNLFDTELIEDQRQLIREVADDFWRRTFYPAPVEFAGFALNRLKGPQYFYRLLESVKTPVANIIPQADKPSMEALEPFRSALAELKAVWADCRDEVSRLLMAEALNANIYGGLKAGADPLQPTARQKKIGVLVEMMDQLAHPQSIGFPLFEGFEKFTATKLSRSTKKNQQVPEHDFFVLCDQVFSSARHLQAQMEHYLLYVKNRVFDFAAGELPKRKEEKNVQSFDDLLVAVRNALAGVGGHLLAQAVRDKYRAALVDEFQDTDSIQYEILARLFSHRNGLLFMIGDPKQAIYGFRGADIFSYMKAARHADEKFTLTANWRSRPRLIAAVNAIFSSVRPAFVFDEIPFENGHPAPGSNEASQDIAFPFVLWHLDASRFSENDKPLNKPDAVRLIAQAVAAEICRLLSASNRICNGPEPRRLNAVKI